MINLPQHISEKFKITSPVEGDTLHVVIDSTICEDLPFALSSDELAKAINELQTDNYKYQFYKVKYNFTEWKYIKINIGTEEHIEIAYSPINLASKPSTAIGILFFNTWFKNPSLILDDENSTNILIKKQYQQEINQFVDRFVQEWTKTITVPWNPASIPPWAKENGITISSDSKLLIKNPLSMNYDKLFLQTITEVKSKWRFLSLYRIFEHGYLDEIFQKLQKQYFLDPSNSIKDASKALESEINQIVELVGSNKLEKYFETISDIFEASKSKSNKFAYALDYDIKNPKDPKKTTSKWSKGALICYKIRCSIVHAGISAPIYDNYDDADIFTEEMIPVMEEAVSNYLGINYF